jgi:hypothetical protein
MRNWKEKYIYSGALLHLEKKLIKSAEFLYCTHNWIKNVNISCTLFFIFIVIIFQYDYQKHI